MRQHPPRCHLHNDPSTNDWKGFLLGGEKSFGQIERNKKAHNRFSGDGGFNLMLKQVCEVLPKPCCGRKNRADGAGA
jgi:hypothetical protein